MKRDVYEGTATGGPDPIDRLHAALVALAGDDITIAAVLQDDEGQVLSLVRNTRQKTLHFDSELADVVRTVAANGYERELGQFVAHADDPEAAADAIVEWAKRRAGASKVEEPVGTSST